MVWDGVWRWGAPKEEQAHPLNLRWGRLGHVPRKCLVYCTWWPPSQVTERRCKPARTRSLKMESVRFCDPLDSSLPGSPPSMGFSRLEHWSGLPCPPPGELPYSEMEPKSVSPALQADSLPLEPLGKPVQMEGKVKAWHGKPGLNQPHPG